MAGVLIGQYYQMHELIDNSGDSPVYKNIYPITVIDAIKDSNNKEETLRDILNTKESLSNKKKNLLTPNDVTYPTTKAVSDGLNELWEKIDPDQYEKLVNKVVLVRKLDATDLNYPTEKAVRTALDDKLDYVLLGAPNGVPKLDEAGKIPLKYFDLDRMSKSVANLNQLLDYQGEIYTGDTVFVHDASDDPTVTSGWAMYRKTNSETTYNLNLDWIKIMEQETLDYRNLWSKIEGGPTASPEDIDEAVLLSHFHNNKTYLDKFSEYENNPTYNSRKLAYSWELESKIITSKLRPVGPDYQKLGDYWFEMTDVIAATEG